MATEVIKQEFTEHIATRVPPGDNWELNIDLGVVIEGLVPTLTTYLRKTKFVAEVGTAEVRFKSNLLRSNCRVTNQPDWGDVYIRMQGTNIPSPESLAKYIVSHRTVSHFHEEICEMVFKHLTDAYKPEQLMVACLYTRRGGLDINPIRATHQSYIPDFFTDPKYTIAKTLRQ